MSKSWSEILKGRAGQLVTQPATTSQPAPVVTEPVPIVEPITRAPEPEWPTALDLWLRSVNLMDWPAETCWVIQQGNGQFGVMTEREMVAMIELAEQHNAAAQRKWQESGKKTSEFELAGDRHTPPRKVRNRGVPGLFSSPEFPETARSGAVGELPENPSGTVQQPVGKKASR